MIDNRKPVQRFLTLAGGAWLAQLVVAIATPALAYLYGPAIFGGYAVATAFSVPLSAAMTGRYELAIPARPIEDLPAIIIACVACVLASTLVAAAVLALPVPLFQSLADAAGIHHPTLVVALGAATALTFPVDYTYLKCGLIRQGWISRVAQIGSQTAIQVGAGLSHAGASGLVWGVIAGCLVRSVMCYAQCRPKLGCRPSYAEVRMLAGGLRAFPLWSAPTAVVTAIGQSLPAPIIAGLFGHSAAGFYAMAQRLAMIPVRGVSNPAQKIIASELHDGLEFAAGFGRSTMILVGLALAVYGPLALAAIWLLPPLLGREWSGVGSLLIALIPAIAARFVIGPLSLVMIEPALQRSNLAFATIAPALAAGMLWLLGYSGWGVVAALGAYSSIMVMSGVVQWAVLRSAAGAGAGARSHASTLIEGA